MPHVRLRRILASVLALVASAAFAFEEPEYDVVEQFDDVEIRRYGDGVLAEVSVEANRDDATEEAFRILVKYIGGDNEAEQKISMTAPVVQRARREATDDGFDEAALGRPRTWTVAFFLPSAFALDETPAPSDERIALTRFEGGTMAAIRFSGFWSDENFAEHARELKTFLTERGYEISGGPVFAYYDPPFMPWFMRRNEVLYPLASGTGPS